MQIIKGLAEYLAPRLVTLLMKSIKIKMIYKDEIRSNAVYIFWHGKMLGGWCVHRKLNPGALVSLSKDGELLSKLLTGWGYNLFRGSSSAGGTRAKGLQVPRDLSVVGFDDIPMAALLSPQLTTMRQPLQEMGRSATQMLLDLLRNPEERPQSVIFPTELVVRETAVAPSVV